MSTTTSAIDPVEAARRRIQAIEDAEDAEFDYELYKRADHPISKVDWRDIPLFDVGLNHDTLNDDTEAVSIDVEALRNMNQAIDPLIEAEDFKRQGNDALKKGNQYRVAAIKLYTRAIKCNVTDEKKRSVYFANRAHANLIGENYGNCISDCKWAIKLDPSAVKAFYRAAKASLALKKLDDCAQFCAAGLQVDADNADIKALQEQCYAAKRTALKEKKQREARARAARLTKEQRSEQLVSLLSERGATLGAPWAKNMPLKSAVTIDDAGTMHCRVVFLYDEYQQSDTVEDMSEDDTFADHLGRMFPPLGAPPPWDVKGRYIANDLDLYCVLNQTRALAGANVKANAGGAPRWQSVSSKSTLGELLRSDGYVIPGIVTVHVVVRGSPHAKILLAFDPSQL